MKSFLVAVGKNSKLANTIERILRENCSEGQTLPKIKGTEYVESLRRWLKDPPVDVVILDIDTANACIVEITEAFPNTIIIVLVDDHDSIVASDVVRLVSKKIGDGGLLLKTIRESTQGK